MKLLRKVHSRIDNTVKYVFDVHGQPVEFTYINKNDGKDIVCVPSQTSCKLGCTFCFLTAHDRPVINLTTQEMLQGVQDVLCDSGVHVENTTLLISFMGAGEPLCNREPAIDACKAIKEFYGEEDDYQSIRFAVATLMPSRGLVLGFIAEVKEYGLPVKMHLSLHSPFHEERTKMMPAAIPPEEAVELLGLYAKETGNPVEIHYTLIDGVNDTRQHADALAQLAEHVAPVKILAFKEGVNSMQKASRNVEAFRFRLEMQGVQNEFYDPPGSDIGSSCGMFLIDEHPLSLTVRTALDHAMEYRGPSVGCGHFPLMTDITISTYKTVD